MANPKPKVLNALQEAANVLAEAIISEDQTVGAYGHYHLLAIMETVEAAKLLYNGADRRFRLDNAEIYLQKANDDAPYTGQPIPSPFAPDTIAKQ